MYWCRRETPSGDFSSRTPGPCCRVVTPPSGEAQDEPPAEISLLEEAQKIIGGQAWGRGVGDGGGVGGVEEMGGMGVGRVSFPKNCKEDTGILLASPQARPVL